MRQRPARPARPARWDVLRARYLLAFALAALALTIAGCSVPDHSTQAPTSDSLSVHVLRTSAFPQNHIPPFDETITNPAKAQALSAALNALPPFPKGVYSCPIDLGMAYHLTFSRGQALTSSATVKPDGCEAVTLSKGDIRWAVDQPRFWAVFADALGIPQSALFPSPQPSGPSAPQAPPNQP